MSRTEESIPGVGDLADAVNTQELRPLLSGNSREMVSGTSNHVIGEIENSRF